MQRTGSLRRPVGDLCLPSRRETLPARARSLVLAHLLACPPSVIPFSGPTTAYTHNVVLLGRAASAGLAWYGGWSTSAFSTLSDSGKSSIPTSCTSTSACSWPTSLWSVCRQLGGPSAHLTGLLVQPLWPKIITPSSLPRNGIVLSAACGLGSASKPTTCARLARGTCA